jgi:uncharacterized membrane protein (Fun14 family)
MGMNHFFKINIIIISICFLTVSALFARGNFQTEEDYFFDNSDFIQIAFIYEEETTPNTTVNESSRVEINEKREPNILEKKYEELKKENDFSDINTTGRRKETEQMITIGYVGVGLLAGFVLGYEQAFNQNENSWNLSVYKLAVEDTRLQNLVSINATGAQFAYLWWLRSFNFMFSSTLKLNGYYIGPLVSLNLLNGEYIGYEFDARNIGIGLKFGNQYSFDNGFSVGLMGGYSKIISIGEAESNSDSDFDAAMKDAIVNEMNRMSGFMYGIYLGFAF